MTHAGHPFAALVLAHDATDTHAALIAAAVAVAVSAGAAPVVVVLPPALAPPEAPSPARVVRTRANASAIGALRIGMGQLTNTRAGAVVILPVHEPSPSLPQLAALLDAAARAPTRMVAFAGASLDRSPVLVPRSAWLELMTLGEGGMDAVAARCGVERLTPP